MSKASKVSIVAVLLLVVGAVVAMKYRGGPGCACTPPPAITPPDQGLTAAPAPASQSATDSAPRPRLIEFGAGKCLMCRRMAPIIDALKHDFADQLTVEKVDVFDNRDTATQFNIRLIPAQVFLSPDGRELFRHEGFFSREEILATWKSLGYELSDSASGDE